MTLAEQVAPLLTDELMNKLGLVESEMDWQSASGADIKAHYQRLRTLILDALRDHQPGETR